MDPIKVDFSKKDGGKKKEIIIPPEKAPLKIIISLIGTVIIALVTYYFMLPAINFKAIDFYLYIGIIAASYVVMNGLLTNVMAKPEYVPYVKKRAVVPGIIIALLVVVVGVGYIFSSVFFRAKDYSQIITVNTDCDFRTEIAEETAESFSAIPKLDDEAAAQLATRALGGLTDVKIDGESTNLVSQFKIYPMYTQINYKTVPVRVVPLQYDNIIKWLTNRRDGLPGYIMIDMADESTEFVTVDGGIKYSPAEHFNRLLERQLRFNYPTYMFAETTFEIDEQGNPYWICARLDKTIGLFGGTDVIGAVLVKANSDTFESEYYDIQTIRTEPSLQWIDRVYDSDLLVEQYDYYGRYQGGFWNSILGQKGVINTTQGYNYIAKDDDVWMYTGITSVTSDDSITGFALINQRTKEAQYYLVSGGTERSAQSAAQGRVKDLGYVATFPLLLNIGGEETYFMSLKDASNIVQQYAMINVENYNKVGATGSDLAKCLNSYIESLRTEKNVKVDLDPSQINEPSAEGGKPADEPKYQTVTGTVAEIRTSVNAGQSVYYIKLDGADTYYSVASSDFESVVILNAGNTVTVSFIQGSEGAIVRASDFKIG